MSRAVKLPILWVSHGEDGGTGDPGRSRLTLEYCLVMVPLGTALLLTGVKWRDREGCDQCTVAFDLTGNN